MSELNEPTPIQPVPGNANFQERAAFWSICQKLAAAYQRGLVDYHNKVLKHRGPQRFEDVPFKSPFRKGSPHYRETRQELQGNKPPGARRYKGKVTCRTCGFETRIDPENIYSQMTGQTLQQAITFRQEIEQWRQQKYPIKRRKRESPIDGVLKPVLPKLTVD